MKLWKRISARMHELNMSQKEFCQRTGLSQSTVSGWKSKDINPTADKLLVICKVLDVSPEWLLEDGDFQKRTDHFSSDYYMIEKTSEIGSILLEIDKLDSSQFDRVIGYLAALEQLNTHDH